MLKSVIVGLCFCLVFRFEITWAKISSMEDQWVEHGFLTKEQAQALGKSAFSDWSCAPGTVCPPKVNFNHDCGILISYGAKPSLISYIDNLRIRVAQYPNILKAFGKWDRAQQRVQALDRSYKAPVVIANTEISLARRLNEARPILKEADDISKQIASIAGFAYEACELGAPPEDSQKVEFLFSEKPKSAFYILQMDLDTCKHILDDPSDPSKCDLWERITQLKNHDLSGNYQYRVIWSDGTVTERSFRALSSGKKTVEISK